MSWEWSPNSFLERYMGFWRPFHKHVPSFVLYHQTNKHQWRHLAFGMGDNGFGVSHGPEFLDLITLLNKITFNKLLTISPSFMTVMIPIYVWSPHLSEIFSVKSFCFKLPIINYSSYGYAAIKGIWRGLVPPRIEVFVWMALLGKINTREKLGHMGVIPPDETHCPLCLWCVESCTHLFLHKDFSWQVWFQWLHLWGLWWVFPYHLRESFNQWRFEGSNKFFKKVCVTACSK